MDNNNNVSGGGVGIAGVLTIVFIVLKALGFITWSWWWVFSPLWICAALFAAIFIIGLLAMIILHLKG